MLKITEKLENDSVLRLKLDGTINSDSYKDLEQVFSRHQGEMVKTIILDMAGVEFMSEEVARRLARLRSEHQRIINCSPFISTLLETVDTPGT